jgi:hypothetical protein
MAICTVSVVHEALDTYRQNSRRDTRARQKTDPLWRTDNRLSKFQKRDNWMKPIGQTAKYALVAVISTTLMTLTVSAEENANRNTRQNVQKVSFNWHGNAKIHDATAVTLSKKERKQMAARIARHGNGSYICSPSGFGHLSRCYTR